MVPDTIAVCRLLFVSVCYSHKIELIKTIEFSQTNLTIIVFGNCFAQNDGKCIVIIAWPSVCVCVLNAIKHEICPFLTHILPLLLLDNCIESIRSVNTLTDHVYVLY